MATTKLDKFIDNIKSGDHLEMDGELQEVIEVNVNDGCILLDSEGEKVHYSYGEISEYHAEDFAKNEDDDIL